MLKIAKNDLILHLGSFGFSRIFFKVPTSDFIPVGP